jgi:hypothetical protein
LQEFSIIQQARQDVLINVTNKTQLERKILNFFQRIRLANKLKEDKPLSQLKIRKGFRMLLINTCPVCRYMKKKKSEMHRLAIDWPMKNDIAIFLARQLLLFLALP